MYTFTRKGAVILCLGFNEVCLELLSYLQSVSHVINSPRLLPQFIPVIREKVFWALFVTA